MNSISTLLFLLAAATSTLSLPTIRSGCSIDVQNGIGEPQPLILKSEVESNDYEAFHLPTEGEQIHLQDNDVILVGCPGGSVKVSGSSKQEEQLEARCTSGKFEIEGKIVSFNQITCTRIPFHTARYTGEKCLGNKREIEVGFHLKDNDRFIRQLNICFDDELLNAEYSYFTMSKSIAGHESGVSRPNFIDDDFYPFDVNSFYVRKKQRTTINALVGLSSGSTKYVAASSDYFLSRGHLSAKADFIYGTQQRATFHYVNVAPQWQTFNGKNWNSLEMDVREYVSNADSYDTRYTVYTGTHGITTLPHEETGEDVPLFLHVAGDKKTIPVPQLYWRILKNEDTQEAVAFVGVNNPYHKDVSDEIICESICDQLSWLSWKGDDLGHGYSYCCTVEDLRRTVKNVPEFEVSGLLV